MPLPFVRDSNLACQWLISASVSVEPVYCMHQQMPESTDKPPLTMIYRCVWIDVYKRKEDEKREKEKRNGIKTSWKCNLAQENKGWISRFASLSIVWYAQTKILWEIFSLMLYIPIVYPILQIMLFFWSRKKKNSVVCVCNITPNK